MKKRDKMIKSDYQLTYHTEKKPYNNISKKTIQGILIFNSMLPLPFPISFSLSFVTLWVSSLPYLPEWLWGEEAFAPRTTLIYSFPSLQSRYQM